jgi:nitroreductase
MSSTLSAIAKPQTGVLKELIARRRSCRGFLPDQVPHERIVEMLAIAQGAASWCNSQPWELIITEGGATEKFREALYAFASANDWSNQQIRPERPDYPFPLKYEGIYKERQRETGWALYQSVGIARGDREASGRQVLENFRFFGAPHVAIVTAERDLGVYAAIDCGSYLANLLLAAQSLGIATIAQAAIAGCADFVREYFDIPTNRQIICGVSFGYEDPGHPANQFRTTRAPLDQVARFVAA